MENKTLKIHSLLLGLNFCCIFLLVVWLGINNNLNTIAINKVDEMEIRLNTMESIKSDTIMVNIYNNVDVPKPKVVVQMNKNNSDL